MAQTQHENVQHIDRNANVITAEMWAKAAESRNFRVHDGVPMIEKDGALAPLPVPNMESGAVLGLMFHAWAEYNRNRIGGSLNGVSFADALAKVARDGSGAPSPKSNDAFDSIYQDRIAELVDNAKGWTVEAIKAMDLAGRTERTKLIDASAFSGSNAAKNHAKYYDEAIKAALTQGATAGAKRETTRKTSSTKESIEL